MSCPHKIELSRSVAAGGGRAYEEHVASCPQCADEVEQHRRIAALTRANLPLVVPDAETAQRARGALLSAAAARREPAATSPWRRWLLLGAPALALAAVLVVVLVGSLGDAPTYRGTVTASVDGTAFRRTSAAPDEVVRLTSGELTVRVAPLATGERFRVITGDAEIEVRGTELVVEAVDDHLRSVRVIEGRVEVRAAGASPQILVTGEQWDLRVASAEPAASTIVAPGTPEPTAAVAPPADTSSATPPSTTPPGPEPVLAPAPVHHEAVPERPSVPSSASLPPASTPARAPSVPPVSTPGKAPSVPPPSAPPKAPSVPTAPTISTGSATAPAVARRRIEVLFDQGFSALSVGDAAAAAEAFEAAATSDPSDPLAEDAWFWNASALVRMKSGDAIGALERFIKRYPKSPRTGEAKAMLGWLVLPSDLDRAEALFQVAAADRSAAVRASATKGLTAVERKRATP